MENKKLSSCESLNQRVNHTHFTKLVKRHGFEILKAYNIRFKDLQYRDLGSFFANTDIAKYVGGLPPELRALVKKEDIPAVTDEFFEKLDFLVVDKGEELSHHTEMKYYLTDIGELFNTLCVLETYERLENLDYAYREWGGAVGDVYKLTFPEIHAEYALKVFKTIDRDVLGHGADFEILTAFCANKSEPKKNTPVYIAGLFCSGQFMLSKWQKQIGCKSFPMKDFEPDDCAIYKTESQEVWIDNYINGKRIDFGKTFKTAYGRLSYNGRKIFRKIRNMTIPEMKKFSLQMKTNTDKQDFEKACDVLCMIERNARLNSR